MELCTINRSEKREMLTRHKCWVHGQGRNENAETIRAFIIEKAEFQMAAAETIHGFQKVNISCQKKASDTYSFLPPLYKGFQTGHVSGGNFF